MKIAEIKKGMKVYPIMKSIEGPLGKSQQWELAAEKGYMTVVKIVDKDGQKPWFECSSSAAAQTGDKFHAGDLRLFGSKPAVKAVAKKPVAKKPVAKKPVAKKPIAKPVAKKAAAKPAAKKPAPRPFVKPVVVSKPGATVKAGELKLSAELDKEANEKKQKDDEEKRLEMQKHSSTLVITPGTGKVIHE
jgi:hypothetical protein